MNDRNQSILRQLIANDRISEDELIHKYQLTTDKLRYIITQINLQLEEHNLSKIVRRKGAYYLSKDGIKLLTENMDHLIPFFTIDDRIQIIFFIILSRKDIISLDHLAIDLKVSKNTVLNTIKKCKVILEDNQLLLEYSRKAGYYIVGPEWNKRIILLNSITIIYRTYGERLLNHLLLSSEIDNTTAQKMVVQVEQFLSIKYTDENFSSLVCFISVLLRRIEKGFYIKELSSVDLFEIMDTKEYQALTYIANHLSTIPNEDLIFISLHLLGSNTRHMYPLKEEDFPALRLALWEFLNAFEANSFVKLSDKKALLERLIKHFKPAYYRVKYKLPFENVLYEQIVEKYHALHDFVKRSITTLETFFETKISDKEIAYVTLFIGGHLLERKSEDYEDKTIKAVVLCPNGVSMSKLLEKTLKDLFPEFMFYPSSSVRDYKGFVLPHNIVFSTVPLESDKKVYLVSNLMTEGDKLELRRRVIKELFKIDFSVISSKEILDVVKKHSSIGNSKAILRDLDRLLVGHIVDESKKETSLTTILTKDRIKIIKHQEKWIKILENSSQLLVDDGVINEDYTMELVHEYENQPPHIILNNEVILPHLDPDKLEQDLGVSLIIINNGIEYNNQLIHFVVLLTTPDKTSHLNILFDIDKLANNMPLISELKNVENANEALTVISKYFK